MKIGGDNGHGSMRTLLQLCNLPQPTAARIVEASNITTNPLIALEKCHCIYNLSCVVNDKEVDDSSELPAILLCIILNVLKEHHLQVIVIDSHCRSSIVSRQ